MTRPVHIGIRRDVLVPPGAKDLVHTAPQVNLALAALDRVEDGGLSVWYGAPGTGKSATAWMLCTLARERSARAAAYMEAPAPTGSVWDERKALRAMIGALGTPLSDRAVRGRSTAEVVRHFATRLLVADVRLLVLDEAGFLGLEGLEAVCMLSEHMRCAAEAFHVVLVGMMEIPELLRMSPRVRSRVLTIDHVAGVSVEALGQVVERRHPWVHASLAEGVSFVQVMEAAHRLTGGCFREAIALFRHLRSDCQLGDIRLNPDVLEFGQEERREQARLMDREEVRQAAIRDRHPALMPADRLQRFRNARALAE